jgi:hypothetical protein
MRIVYLLLLGLLGVSPIFLFVDGPLAHAFIIAFGAIALTLVASFMPPREAGHLATAVRPVSIMAAIVAFWMLVQLVPLPKSLAHPIWSDAETALGAWVPSSITVDPGATVVAICRYFSTVAILLVAAAVTIDRERAARVLLWILGAATVSAVLQFFGALVAFLFIDISGDVSLGTSTAALSALGVVTALAASVNTIERRYEKALKEVRGNLIAISPILIGCAICGVGLITFAPRPVSIAAAAALATFVVIMIVRRLGFGVWTGNSIAGLATIAVIAIAILSADSYAVSGDLALRYASHSLSSLNSITQRIIADTNRAGSGAGTFKLLLPVYGGSLGAPTGLLAPTAAAKIAAELGLPALWALVVMAVLVLFLLIQGSLERGRDWIYPALGAGCVVMLCLETFCDVSLFSTSVFIGALVTLGLALSQRLSRMGR